MKPATNKSRKFLASLCQTGIAAVIWTFILVGVTVLGWKTQAPTFETSSTASMDQVGNVRVVSLTTTPVFKNVNGSFLDDVNRSLFDDDDDCDDDGDGDDDDGTANNDEDDDGDGDDDDGMADNDDDDDGGSCGCPGDDDDDGDGDDDDGTANNDEDDDGDGDDDDGMADNDDDDDGGGGQCVEDLECTAGAITNDGPVNKDENITFSIPIKNTGQTEADATVKFYYPSNRLSGSGDDACGAGCGEISLNVNNLGPGATETLNVTLTALVGDADSPIPATVVAEVFTDNIDDIDSTPGNVIINVIGDNLSPVFSGDPDDECLGGTQLLPVELTTFDAVLDGRAAVLRWATASETNNAGFEVQHRFGDDAFKVMDFIQGHGTTIEEQQYSYRADDLDPGRHVFRLKQIDFDGTFEYSPELEVTVEMPEMYLLTEVYPNPFNPEARLDFAVRQSQEVTVTAYNMLGQRVLEIYSGVPSTGVTQSLVIDGSGLQSGTYVVRIQGERFVETRTFTLVK